MQSENVSSEQKCVPDHLNPMLKHPEEPKEEAQLSDFYLTDVWSPSKEEADAMFKKESLLDRYNSWMDRPFKPFVNIEDLNNSDDAPYENKPKPAVVIGFEWKF